MNKIFSKNSLIIYGSLALFVLIVWVVKAFSHNDSIKATVRPLYVKLGSPIHFSDSTWNAQSVTWDFGNGDVSTQRSGDYTFKKKGLYQVRLTIDNSRSIDYEVVVKDPNIPVRKKPTKILAPDTAIICERVPFTVDGKVDKCMWYFKNYNDKYNDHVYSNEKYAVYTFNNFTTYQVTLKFPDKEDSLTHTITVLPIIYDCCCNPGDHIPNPLQNYLQKIVDRKDEFYTNYNKIKSLLRTNKDDLTVLINGTKEIDLNTYCKKLRLMGKQNSVEIQEVEKEYDSIHSRVVRLLVTQTSK